MYLVNKMNVKELFTAFEAAAGTDELEADSRDNDSDTADMSEDNKDSQAAEAADSTEE